MLFETILASHFNKPDSLFYNKQIYLSFSKIGYLSRDGFVSPNGANAISHSKKISIKKSFSEMLERRNLMLGGHVSADNMVHTWDLIKKAPASLPHELTIYRIGKNFASDTTGTATHIESTVAVHTATKELLEKNALFLFWYGKRGFTYKISNEILKESPILQSLLKDSYEVSFFVNDSFFPLRVIFTVVQKNNSVASCGIGSALNFNDALQKSVEEAFLLKWQKEFNEIIESEYLDVFYTKEKQSDDLQLRYIEELNKLPLYRDSPEGKVVCDITECFPSWMTNLHVIYLKNLMYPSLKCVKVFSYDLYNHVPIHQYIDIKQPINQNTLSLTENELYKVPNCIFV